MPESKGALKIILFLVIFASLFVGSVYWLWQRQPKSPKAETPSAKIEDVKIQAEESDIKPSNFSVLLDQKVKLEGKADPDSYVVIFSNSFDQITTADSNGKFQKEIILVPGLNQIVIALASNRTKEINSKQVIFYLASQKENVGNTVFAGSVKAIFDNLITLNTEAGEKSVKAEKTAEIDLPKINNKEDEAESTGSAFSKIRIGDYLIALGNISSPQKMNASKIQIIRENKPQVEKTILQATAVSGVRQNLFSAKSENGKILELSIGKKSQLLSPKGDTDIKNIQKDKKLLLTFHTRDDDKIVDLLYLVP